MGIQIIDYKGTSPYAKTGTTNKVQQTGGDFTNAVMKCTGTTIQKADYISYAQAVMEDYKTLGNWDSYLAMDKWIQSFLDYTEKCATNLL